MPHFQIPHTSLLYRVRSWLSPSLILFNSLLLILHQIKLLSISRLNVISLSLLSLLLPFSHWTPSRPLFSCPHGRMTLASNSLLVTGLRMFLEYYWGEKGTKVQRVWRHKTCRANHELPGPTEQSVIHHVVPGNLKAIVLSIVSHDPGWISHTNLQQQPGPFWVLCNVLLCTPPSHYGLWI